MEENISYKDMIEQMRQSPFIREKRIDENISSFNFTRKAFWRKEWNDLVCTARGLFMDTKNCRVKARSYDKFFALGERPETTLEYISNHWEYPLNVYVKENGYLGICSWNEDGTLFCASKSTTEGIYAERFKEILLDTLGGVGTEHYNYFYNILRSTDSSAVFEVIDPEYDTHLIEYDRPRVVLLDVIENNDKDDPDEYWGCWYKSYEVLEVYAICSGLELKRRVRRIWSPQALKKFVEEVTARGYKYNGEYIEGFVVEGYSLDKDNWDHFKIKCDYYSYWKAVRSLIIPMSKLEYEKRHYYLINDERFDKMEDWMKRYCFDYYAENNETVNVIQLRHDWEEIQRGVELLKKIRG